MNTFSLQVGLRYLSGSRRGGYLSFISLVSFIGLTLGVMVLTIVVSVMNGFDSELKERILGAVPHMVVKIDANDSEELEQYLASLESVKATSPFLEKEALLLSEKGNEMGLLHGVEPSSDKQTSNVHDFMVNGSLAELGKGNIMLGIGLAARLGVVPGDHLTILIPDPVGDTVRPRAGKMIISGLFQLNSELDYRLAVMDVSALSNLAREQAGLRISLWDVFEAPTLSTDLRKRFPEVIALNDWSAQHGDFFQAVKMEKVMMFVLLSLIVVVAAFNIVSSLSIMVNDRQAEISVMKTMGANRSQVMLIFVCQGAAIGMMGCMAGLMLGLPAAWAVGDIVRLIETLLGGQVLAGTYFSELPSEIRVLDILVILMISFCITLLATLYPAYRAATLEPAKILRAE